MVGVAMFLVALAMALANLPGIMRGDAFSIGAGIFCFCVSIVNLIFGIMSL